MIATTQQVAPWETPLPKVVLTPVRKAILKRRAEGLMLKEIATELGMSSKTVEWHMDVLYRWLGFHSLALLTQYALKHGIAEWKL